MSLSVFFICKFSQLFMSNTYILMYNYNKTEFETSPVYRL